MRNRALLVGGVCFLLGAIGAALAATAMRPDQFVAAAWTWSALQTFTNSDFALLGSSTGKTTLTSANAGASNYTLTLPAASTTVPIITQTVTLSGPTASRTYTVPDSSVTLAALSVAQTWSNHQGVTPVALSDGSSITVNGTDANAYTLTIAGNNHTLSCPSTVSYGSYTFQFTNSGGATGFAVNSCYHFASGTAPSWSSTNGKIDAMFCHAFNNSNLDCSASIDSR